MRIDGITCCVGDHYIQLLSSSIEIWARTLKTITIVTNEASLALALETFSKYQNVQVISTNIFYEHGAKFNKGAALNIAYAAADPTEWCLHFDSDITPPIGWSQIARQKCNIGSLYGAFRYDSLTGQILDEHPLFPYGYFHLWHVEDPVVLHWPLFEVHHPHAGNYDSNFAEQWSRFSRADLGFRLLHVGNPRQNWYGAHDSPEMAQLRAQGLANVRQSSNQGYGNLDLPEPKARIVIWPKDMANVQRLLKFARSHYSPFEIDIVASLKLAHKLPPGWLGIMDHLTDHHLERVIDRCSKS